MTSLLAALLMAGGSPEVTLDFTRPKGLIVVQAEGNGGKTMRMLLDTGAQRTVVDATMAKSLGLEPGETVKARGAGGTVDGRFAKGLRLVGLADGPLEAVALPLDAISQALGTPIDAILGQDVLATRVVDIDGAAGKVTFGTRPAAVSSAAGVVSLHLRGGRPYLMATVIGPSGTESDAEMLLDTGSDTVAELGQPYADEVGLRTRPDPDSRRILGVGGTVAVRVADLRELRLGRSVVAPEDVRIFAHPVGASGDGDGRIGNGFLSRFRTTIDGPGRKLVLTPIRGG